MYCEGTVHQKGRSNFAGYRGLALICSPSWVLKHVSEDGVREEGVVVAHADVGAPHLVLAGDLVDPVEDVDLALKKERFDVVDRDDRV